MICTPTYDGIKIWFSLNPLFYIKDYDLTHQNKINTQKITREIDKDKKNAKITPLSQ